MAQDKEANGLSSVLLQWGLVCLAICPLIYLALRYNISIHCIVGIIYIYMQCIICIIVK